MLNRFRFVLLPGVLSLLAATAAVAGSIRGRVTDSGTGLALGGVRVSVAGSTLETYTAADGTYTLWNVPEGGRELSFSYVGYPEITRSLVVEEGATRLDVSYGEAVVEMERMVIEGAVVGTARAINQQRAAATLRHIVAADEIGRFPDQNAAEALQRVPGVSLYRDQGEGRYLVLRGLNFTFTSVKLNGGSFAGADLGERATPLDTIPADALAALEVTKVPTPDLDGEGLGGQIDIRTKSPFDAEGLDAGFTVQAGYSALTNDLHPKLNGFVSTRFGDNGQYGLLIAPTWQRRRFGSDNYETGGSYRREESPGGGEFHLIEELNYRDYDIERERYGITLSLEAQPDDTAHAYLRAGYNRFTDTEDRHLTLLAFEDVVILALDATGATVSAEEDDGEFARLFARELRMREKDQEVFSVTAGGEKQSGPWQLEGQLTWTEGRERRPDEITAIYEPTDAEGSSFRYTTRGAYGLVVEQLSGPSIFDTGSYGFDQLEVANEAGDETEWDLRLDARRELGTRTPSFVKVGGRYRAKEKTSEVELIEYSDGPEGIQSLADATIGPGVYPYFRVPRISPDAIRDAFDGATEAFEAEREFEDSEFDDWTIQEDVLAAYVMGGVTLGRLQVLGGVRVERTEFDTSGRDIAFDEEGDPAGAADVEAGRSYTNWLPGVHFRYDVNPRLVLRASYSQSLARPEFGHIAVRRNVNREDEEITVGNPDLAELEARNWDVSVEYYLPSLGVVSAAAFRKDIENFAYETEVEADPAFPDYEVTSFRNGSEGTIDGLELAYQQQLRMLPPPFDGIGLLANATLLDSEATYPTRPDERLPFIGQSDLTANLGLTYERDGLFVRLALNLRSERLREDEPVGGERDEDFYIDDHQQLDLTIRYAINRNWDVFAEFINLTDEPFRVFLKSDTGQGDRLGQVEVYDWSANFGVRWKL